MCQRVVLCGSPLAGKKRVLDALAKHLGTIMPTVMPRMTDGEPLLVSWEARFPGAGIAQFETFYGVGFTYDEAVVQMLSRPLSAIIYVLRPLTDPLFEETWRESEQDRFEIYSTAAQKFQKGWDDVPWLFIKNRSWAPDPTWMTELIPAKLSTLVLDAYPESGEGIVALTNAIKDLLIGTGQR